MKFDEKRNQDYHNLSLIGRRRAGMTQAEWAEAVGVAVRSVVDYEAMVTLPSAATVVKMAEAARMPVLCYWHMRQSLQYGADMAPQVEELSLPQAVVILIKALRDLEKRDVVGQLLDMADDGRIDLNERPVFEAACEQLRDVIQAAALVAYCDTDGEAI